MNKNIILTDDQPWALGNVVSRPASSPRADAPDGLDLAALLRILVTWRWLIAGAIALGILLGIIATLVTKPVYRASVTLEVNSPTVEIMDEQRRAQSSATAAPWDYVATQVGLLSSRSIAERAAEDLKLASNPDFVGEGGTPEQRLQIAAGRISGGLKVQMPEEGQLVSYTMDADTPQMAAAIANQVADSFINVTLQRRYEASSYARNFLEKQINKARADLEQSEKLLVAYAQAQGIITTSTSQGVPNGDTNSLQGESLVALNKALADATARRVAAEGAYRQGSAVGATADVNAATQAMRQQKAALEAEYQDKRTLLKPDHPDMISLRSRIDELSRQISREASQVSSGRNNSLLGEFRAAQAAESALQARVNALKGSVLDLRGRSIRYTILQRDVDTNRALYEALLQRFKEVGVAGGIGASPVSIVDRADPPGGPYKPNLMINLAVGLLAGLIGGIGLAMVLEFLNDTIKTREDVRNKLGLACLGAVPKSPGKDSFAEELKNPKSSVSEAYSSVAASLRFSTEDGLPRRLLVTSTRSGEGKSSSSLALAQNFARRGAKVLLVDCDLRKPSFRAASEKIGLTRLLTGDDDDISAHVTKTQFDNLLLLPAGPIPPNPADLLSTGRFASILQELQEQFDVIVCDAPPVMGLADAILMAPAVGQVMFVVESGKTRARSALESLRQIGATGAHIVGATLNKSSEDAGGYGYKGYGYGYGNRYGAVDKRRTEIELIPHDGD
ncbi:GumC family protein [Sphingomonas jaspsi]|uniref:GumC family protein n=1 Tax=Sphingomonas jaspsi TaxID=392409 RepID=UPI0004B755FA|nr:polysaccharide biosynthesis tyrosine autokinase [Sphingomonas jaspsi]